MSQPNYPNYPPGGPQQQPSYGQQQAYPQPPQPPQAPQAGGYPQPNAPMRAPAPGALVGPAKMLFVGLIIMIFSFAVKQIVVDISLNSAGNLLQKEKISAQKSSELNEIDRAFDPIDTELEALKGFAPPEETTDKGREALAERLSVQGVRVAKLLKDREDKAKELRPARQAVIEKFAPRLREAERDEKSGLATSLGGVQFALLLKLLMDLLKIAGGALCILSGLRIAADPAQSGGMKAYAATIAGIAFFGLVVGGMLALFG